MPTLLQVDPYRCFCYAGDSHVHVERDESEAKFWLIQKLVEEHQEQLLMGWHDFFGD